MLAIVEQMTMLLRQRAAGNQAKDGENLMRNHVNRQVRLKSRPVGIPQAEHARTMPISAKTIALITKSMRNPSIYLPP